MAYVADKNGHFPSYRPDQSSTHPVNPGIADYLGLKGAEDWSTADYKATAFTCPAIQKTEHRSGRLYFMNIAINGRTTIGHGMSDVLLIKKPVLIEQPSKTMLFTEGAYNSNLGSTVMDTSTNYYTHINWSLTDRMVAPHRERQNVIHLDGHARAYNRKEIPAGAENRDSPFWSGKSL